MRLHWLDKDEISSSLLTEEGIRRVLERQMMGKICGCGVRWEDHTSIEHSFQPRDNLSL